MPEENPPERPHSCEFAQEVAALSSELRQVRAEYRHREKEFIRVSDESNKFRRQLEGCDAGRKQMALTCGDFVGNRNTHPEVIGTCMADNNNPCNMQCKEKNARRNSEGLYFVSGR